MKNWNEFTWIYLQLEAKEEVKIEMRQIVWCVQVQIQLQLSYS